MKLIAADLPCRILLSKTQVNRMLAGKGDEGLRRLRMSSGANIQLPGGSLLPAAFHARDECLAVILADDGKRLRRALTAIMERIYTPTPVIAGLQTAGESEPNQDVVHVVEVMVPEVACRHLVGARGDRIKILRVEAGCEIHLSPWHVAGIAAQRRVKCNGHVSNLVEAVARVHEVLAEFAEIGILALRHFDLQEVSMSTGISAGRSEPGGGMGITTASVTVKNARLALRLLVSADECGWLIGKRGNKIHKLREVAMVGTREADPEVCSGTSGSVVEIFGAPLAQCVCVLQLIVDDLQLFREALPSTRILLPGNTRAILENVSLLEEVAQEKGGCHAQLLLLDEWLLLDLRGTPQERINGAFAVHDIVERALEKNAQVAAENGHVKEHTAGTPRHESDMADQASQSERGSKLSTDATGTAAAVIRDTTTDQLQSVQQATNFERGQELSHCHQQSHPFDDHASLVERESEERKPQVLKQEEHHHDTSQQVSQELCSHQQHHLESKLQDTVRQHKDAERQEQPSSRPDRASSTLWVPLADGELAARLVSTCGIAERAGVVLSIQREGAGEIPGAGVLLKISGTPVANAVACYLLQQAIWLEGALGNSRPHCL